MYELKEYILILVWLLVACALMALLAGVVGKLAYYGFHLI
jgi:hypothetical protein